MRNPYVTPRAVLTGFISVAVGGFLGSLLRGWLTRTTQTNHSSFTQGSFSWHLVPWALLLINAAGVYLAVLLLGRLFAHQSYLDPTRLFLITGFFGGLTSYSGVFVALYAIWQVSHLASILVGLGGLLSGVLAGRMALARTGRHQ